MNLPLSFNMSTAIRCGSGHALDREKSEVCIVHVLIHLLSVEYTAVAVLEKTGVDLVKLWEAVNAEMGPKKTNIVNFKSLPMSTDLDSVMTLAQQEACRINDPCVSTSSFILAMSKYLEKPFGVTLEYTELRYTVLQLEIDSLRDELAKEHTLRKQSEGNAEKITETLKRITQALQAKSQ